MQRGGEPLVGAWLKHSFIDYPGTVATVLFFGGCNLRCPYCHNPALARGETGPVDLDHIVAWCGRRKEMVEGAVLSGGEPTLQGRKLLYAAERLRQCGLRIKLDTNGLLPRVITALKPDYCALDLKTSPERYHELGWRGEPCGSSLRESIAIVKSMEAAAEIRITIAGSFVGEREIDEFCRMLIGVRNVFLQPFRDSGDLLDPAFGPSGPVPEETVSRFRDRLAAVVDRCEVRGR